MTKVIEFYGGPGAGKSTMAAAVFAELKMLGKSAELITETAKDLTWDKNYRALTNQISVLGAQFEKVHRVLGHVDYIVTDSPILLSPIYAPKDYPSEFSLFTKKLQESYESINYFVERIELYDTNGRKESLDESLTIDQKIRFMLEDCCVHYKTIKSCKEDVILVINDILGTGTTGFNLPS